MLHPAFSATRRLTSAGPIPALLFVAVTASLIAFSSPLSAQAQSPAAISGAARARLRPGAVKCCGEDAEAEKPHRLAASYYSVKDNLSATLMLNNKGPRQLVVQPTLFSLAGERFDPAPITVEGNSFRTVNLRALGAVEGTPFEEGSIQLFHLGRDLVLGAQIYLVDAARGLSFDEKLIEPATSKSTRLEGVWWVPSQRSDVRLLLSNTSESSFSVTVTLGAAKHGKPSTLTLAPHETRIISVGPGDGNEKYKKKLEAGGASVEHTGPKGALIARALVKDAGTGYSWSAQFANPQGGKSTGYQGAGLRLGRVAGEELTPVVMARNVGDAKTVVTGRIPYTTADGQVDVMDLPEVRLSPGETEFIDVARAVRERGDQFNAPSVGLEFEYTGTPGSVVMSAQSVSASGEHVFRVPLWDIAAQRSATGGYPWYIEGDSATVAYIKNTTGKKQKYTFQLDYPGGVYSLGLKSVEAGQTVAVDVRALRDGKVPDAQGQVIPAGANRGQILWSVQGPDGLALIGRSEQVDLAGGISSSYACQNCCGDSFYGARLAPFNLFLVFPQLQHVLAYQQNINCYGTLLAEYDPVPFWGNNNTSICNTDHTGGTSSINPGSTNVFAQWDTYYWVTYYATPDSPICESVGVGVLREIACAVKPRISGPRNVWWFNGENPSGYATTITLTAEPANAGSYSWSIVSGADKVTLSANGNTATVTGTTPSSFREVGIRVTADGAASDTYDITVRAPHRLVLIRDFQHFANTGLWYETHISYRIEDQFTDVLPTNVHINEDFTTAAIDDFAGHDWNRTINEGAALIAPSSWFDRITGPDNNPVNPQPRSPCSPLCNTKVYHWNGGWYVGSSTIGRGVRVQTNTWVRYTDHAEHTSRTSPAP